MFENLKKFYRDFFKVDSARISKPQDKMFLIIGNKKSTGDDRQFEWVDEQGNVLVFDYLEEKTVASGKTEQELLASAQMYKKWMNRKLNTYEDLEEFLEDYSCIKDERNN